MDNRGAQLTDAVVALVASTNAKVAKPHQTCEPVIAASRCDVMANAVRCNGQRGMDTESSVWRTTTLRRIPWV